MVASGIIFQDHRRVLVSVFRVRMTTSDPLKRVTEGIFRITSNFMEASKSFTVKSFEKCVHSAL
jgi:hypothetical protein